MLPQQRLLVPANTHRGKGIKTTTRCLLLIGLLATTHALQAQPAKGADKFLGNITTRGQIRSDYLKYWNQITGENESKWESVEGTRDKMNWRSVDTISNYCKRNGIIWKFHTLIWGSQYPRWMDNLSQSEQLEEITEWLDEAAKRYPEVQMIDVINEAYPSHKPPPFKNALGGDGSSGFDWMIKIFQMARERWPKAVLIYNDYNTIEWDSEVNWQVKMANAMKAANAPMDAIGVQAHDAWKVATSTVKNNLNKLTATGYPIIVSEYDIGQGDDNAQKRVMEEQFTMFWNNPKIVGVTYWGYIVGSTWRDGTGLLNTSGTERPALTWLVDFVKKNPSPPNDFPEITKRLAAPDPVATTMQRNTLTPLPQQSFSPYNNGGTMKIFNLQGKVIGVFNNTTPASLNMPSAGRYIVKVNEHIESGFNQVR